MMEWTRKRVVETVRDDATLGELAKIAAACVALGLVVGIVIVRLLQ